MIYFTLLGRDIYGSCSRKIQEYSVWQLLEVENLNMIQLLIGRFILFHLSARHVILAGPSLVELSSVWR